MRAKQYGKSILTVCLTLTLALTCAACGGASGKAPAENTVSAAEYWVCTGLDMGDGEMMDTEAIRSLLGVEGAEVMTLCINGGKGDLYLMGDLLSCEWTKTETGGKLTSPEYDGVVAEFTAGPTGK